MKKAKEKKERMESDIPTVGEDLYNADKNCKHELEALWSGVKCKHCPGWFCY